VPHLKQAKSNVIDSPWKNDGTQFVQDIAIPQAIESWNFASCLRRYPLKKVGLPHQVVTKDDFQK
jgi:hypothetical protein